MLFLPKGLQAERDNTKCRKLNGTGAGREVDGRRVEDFD